jgi:hypothetical protein
VNTGITTGNIDATLRTDAQVHEKLPLQMDTPALANMEEALEATAALKATATHQEADVEANVDCTLIQNGHAHATLH